MGSPDKGGLTVQLQQLPMEGQEHTEQRSTVSVLLRGSLEELLTEAVLVIFMAW